MTGKQDEFLQQLRATFKVEAAEHLQAIAGGLAELDKGPAREARREIVERVFRAAHSLKGAARAVDLVDIEARCQSMEDAFAAWKRQEAPPSAAVLDALHRQLDAIAASLEAPKAAPAPVEAPKAAPREAAPAPAAIPEAPTAPGSAFAADATVRVTIARLNEQLVEAEEMLAAKLVTEQRVKELEALAREFQAWKREWLSVEPEASAPRQQLAPRLKAFEDRLGAVARAAQHDRYTVGRLVDDLLEDSKRLLLLPFSEISGSFPRLVRDLCRDQGKEAQLVVRGEALEIDKRTLEEMKDPLVHLLRNSIVHGVEAPAERARRAKPARATVEVTVSRVNGSKVQITVSDDGAGIDATRVKASAVEHGVVSAEEAARLNDAEARALIFRSEVSTSPMITELSGRGLGLAIVREKAEKLGGDVSVESRTGAGSTFRITVPATRATFRGILVEAAGRSMVVPTAQVERALRVQPADILTVEGRETISFGGRTLPLVSLADVLELPPAEREEAPDAPVSVVVLGSGDQRVAFRVDAVVEEQEILVKPLGKPLSRVRNVAAATVLASGQLVPILHVADLLKSARRAPGRATRAAAPKKEAPAKSILIAEDSITSRMLLKGILESAGYNVRTAVDGMEAFGLLQTEPFDLVVSDVEMPRLNGFDLTARIRADRKLAELPVVLVTALASREDRERGIDVGASAYLVKSSFDQSDLLAAIRRLT